MEENEDYDVKCFCGTTRRQSELLAGFDLVKPTPNWKTRIDAIVPLDADLGLLVDAVVHFTGSVPTLTHTRVNGTYCWNVKAEGYYEAVGA